MLFYFFYLLSIVTFKKDKNILDILHRILITFSYILFEIFQNTTKYILNNQKNALKKQKIQNSTNYAITLCYDFIAT